MVDDAVGEGKSTEPAEEAPWAQRALDNLWLLLALSVLVPAMLYLGWGLWELAELPAWGGS